MPKFMIVGGDGMLAFAIKKNEYYSDFIAFSSKECDITKPEMIEKHILKYKPEYLLNCAAYTDVAGAEKEISAAMDVNAHGAINLALLSNKHQCRLVHFSTDYVFKGDKEIVYKEDMPTNPVNSYGATKQKGEEFVQAVNPSALIVRVSLLYGVNGRNFISKIANIMQQQPEMSAICDRYGKTTYACDVAEATKNLIEKEAVGIYHFANEGICTKYEFTKKIYELLRKKIDFKCDILPLMSFEYPDNTPRPIWSVLDTEKYKQKTGADIRHWEEALEDYVMSLEI